MKLRPAHWYVVIGLALIALAIILQIKLISGDKQVKPLNPVTTKKLYNPQGNSVGGNPNDKITKVKK